LHFDRSRAGEGSLWVGLNRMARKTRKAITRKTAALSGGESANGTAPGGLRERLISAASAVFEERGYLKASTLEIARRARASKRDLYAIFDSKQALLIACITTRAARMRRPLEFPLPENSKSLEQMLQRFASTALREICVPAVLNLYRLAISESAESPHIGRLLEVNGRRPNRAALARLMAQAQSAGSVGRGDPTTMVEQFLGLLWDDLWVRMLLRLAGPPDEKEIQRRSRHATRALLTLYPPTGVS
jgi:AcrR family transcriptional regulator